MHIFFVYDFVYWNVLFFFGFLVISSIYFRVFLLIFLFVSVMEWLAAISGTSNLVSCC